MEAKTADDGEKWVKFAKLIKINLSGSLEGTDDSKNEEQLEILTKMLVTVLPPRHRKVFVELLDKIATQSEEATVTKTPTATTEAVGDPVGVRGGGRWRMKGGRPLTKLEYVECLFIALCWTLSDAIIVVGGGTLLTGAAAISAANSFPTYMNLALGVAAGMQVQQFVDSIFGPRPGAAAVTAEELQEVVANRYTGTEGDPSPAFLQTSFHPPPPGTTVPVGLVDGEPLTLQGIFETQAESIGASVHTEDNASRGIWEAGGSKVAAGIVLCIASLWLFRFIQKIRMKQREVDADTAVADQAAAMLGLTNAQREAARAAAELARAQLDDLKTKPGPAVATELANNAALVTVPPPLKPLIVRGRSPGRRPRPPPPPPPDTPASTGDVSSGGKRRRTRRHRRRRPSAPTRKGRRSSYGVPKRYTRQRRG